MDNRPTTRRLRDLIDNSGKLRQQIAKDLKCDASTITKHYNGDRGINADFIVKYAKYFNVSADYLLGLSKTPSLLLPCPFCGGRADIYYRNYESFHSECYGYNEVGCLKCGVFFSTKHYEMQHPNAKLKLEKDKQECIKAWNRRV